MCTSDHHEELVPGLRTAERVTEFGSALSEFVASVAYRAAHDPYASVPPEETAALKRLLAALLGGLEERR